MWCDGFHLDCHYFRLNFCSFIFSFYVMFYVFFHYQRWSYFAIISLLIFYAIILSVLFTLILYRCEQPFCCPHLFILSRIILLFDCCCRSLAIIFCSIGFVETSSASLSFLFVFVSLPFMALTYVLSSVGFSFAISGWGFPFTFWVLLRWTFPCLDFACLLSRFLANMRYG